MNKRLPRTINKCEAEAFGIMAELYALATARSVGMDTLMVCPNTRPLFKRLVSLRKKVERLEAAAA